MRVAGVLHAASKTAPPRNGRRFDSWVFRQTHTRRVRIVAIAATWKVAVRKVAWVRVPHSPPPINTYAMTTTPLIITLDTERRQIIFNGKIIDADPMFAFALAPTGTIIEVIGNENNLVTLKITGMN